MTASFEAETNHYDDACQEPQEGPPDDRIRARAKPPGRDESLQIQGTFSWSTVPSCRAVPGHADMDSACMARLVGFLIETTSVMASHCAHVNLSRCFGVRKEGELSLASGTAWILHTIRMAARCMVDRSSCNRT